MNLNQFLKEGFSVCNELDLWDLRNWENEAVCLCQVVEGTDCFENDDVCNWIDSDGKEWDVYVLSDGTAITWCADL